MNPVIRVQRGEPYVLPGRCIKLPGFHTVMVDDRGHADPAVPWSSFHAALAYAFSVAKAYGTSVEVSPSAIHDAVTNGDIIVEEDPTILNV